MLSVFRAQAAEARLALVLCWAVILVPILVKWLRVYQHGDGGGLELASAVSLTIAFPLFVRTQLATCRGGADLTWPWVPVALLVATLAPMAFGALSLTVSYTVAAAVLLYRPVPAAVVIGVTGAGFLLLYPQSGLQTVVDPVPALIELMVFAVIFVAVTRLAVLLDDLQFTREVLARRRVDVERERVGRDLHDLMGRTLVAASLRNQTALRTLGDRDPDGAQRLERLHETLSRGQVQLRALTSGPAIARLDDELATARMLAERVNITLEVDVRTEPPGPHEALVGLVVRESITNVLKHSRATTCTIVIDRDDDHTVVRVVNDGTIRTGDTSAAADSRLARAVQAAGGTSVSRQVRQSEFETVSRIPMPQAVGHR